MQITKLSRLSEAENLFADSPINITTEGKRHLGAALGTEEFKFSYIDQKVSEWCIRLRKLSDIAKSQPHVAYSAYIHGEQHRYTYFLRTLENIGENLKALDKVLEEVFIPTIFGRDITAEEREILSLQVKEGGLGLRKISANAAITYQTSKSITAPLKSKIVSQSHNFPTEEEVASARLTTMQHVHNDQAAHANNVINQQPVELQRKLKQISEPVASSWIGALPLSQYGFNLNRGEFQDALAMRYNKPLKNIPANCPCGKKFSTTHALSCTNGGFIHARHDNVRDFEAQLLKIVCNDVETETMLQPVTNRNFERSANVSEEARLDVRARGFWRQGQNAFFDVRITNETCQSQRDSTINSILRKHEMEKKRQYNQRVIEIEQGTFTPLIFTTSGAMGHECHKFHKALAEKISLKKDEQYTEIIRYICVHISFMVLKATLLCVRGSRSLKRNMEYGEDFSQTLLELGC